MKILDHVNLIRTKAITVKNYRVVAARSGVGESWLAKFAAGKIQNPTLDNIAKLEVFFQSSDEKQ